MSPPNARRTVHYNELPAQVGTALPPSDWLRIDQPLIDRFAELTGDHQWIHVDVARANAEIGGTIAHGFLTLSVMPMLAKNILAIEGVTRALNYGFEKVRFTGTVPAGARIRLVQKITAVEEKSGGRLVTRASAIEVEGPDRTPTAKPAVIADWLGLYFPAA